MQIIIINNQHILKRFKIYVLHVGMEKLPPSTEVESNARTSTHKLLNFQCYHSVLFILGKSKKNHFRINKYDTRLCVISRNSWIERIKLIRCLFFLLFSIVRVL